MNGEGRFSEAQLAVLAERLDTIIGQHTETRAAIVTLSQATAQFPVLQERLLIVDGKTDRLFVLSDRSTERLAALESDVKQHAAWWKWVRWVAPFAIAFMAWGYREMRMFQEADSAMAGRLTLIEFVMNSKPGAPLVPSGAPESQR